MSDIPIIRMELQGMKTAMLLVLRERQLQVDQDMQAAVEAFCTEGNLKAVLQQQVKDCLTAAVREDVREFFSHSEKGRAAVREAVEEHLNSVLPEQKPKVRADLETLHNLTTHRAAWRNALVYTESQVLTEDNRAYWQHEIKAFDALAINFDNYVKAQQ